MTLKPAIQWALAIAASLLAAHAAVAEIAVDVGATVEMLAPGSPEPAAATTAVDPSAALAAPEPDADRLEFANGDKLHGILVAIAGEPPELTWHREDLSGPMRLQTGGIDAVDLGSRGTGTTKAQARVVLTNDDELTGEILGLDGDTLRLRTWYAGELAIHRSMLRSFSPNSEAATRLYRGPMAADEWTFPIVGNGPSWRYERGTYQSVGTGALGRKFENLPDDVRVDFHLTWNRYARLHIALFSDRIDRVDSDSYLFSLNGSSAAVMRRSPREGSRSLGTVQLPDLQNRARKEADITLLCSRKTHRLAMMVDNRLVQEWKDSGKFDGKGNCVVFQPHSTSYRVGIGPISVSRWDGNISAAVDEPDPKSDKDFVRFVNNDKITGELLSMDDKEAKFKTSYATLSVPVERIAQVVLTQQNAERARRNKGDIRAFLDGGGRVTFRLAELDQGRLSGASENFGDIRAELAAFRRIEFNIYRP